MPNDLAHTYVLFIHAPVSEVWRGLVDGEMTRHYVYGTRRSGELRAGAAYAYLAEGDFKVVDGEILEVEPERRLVMTWRAHWSEAVEADRASRVAFELSASGGVTKLRVVHDDFDGPTATYAGSVEGWPLMLSSLKSLLETGSALPVAS